MQQIRKVWLVGGIAVLMMFPSCLKDLPESFPEGYQWNPDVAFPIGEAEFGIPTGIGFDSSLLQPDTTGSPAWTAYATIPFSETIEVDFTSLFGNRERIRYVLLRLNIYNGYPAVIYVQGYLRNEFDSVVDSLLEAPARIEAGSLVFEGDSVEYAYSQFDVLFEGDDVDLLYEANRFEVRGTVQRVDSFPEFSFRLQLAADVGFMYRF
jgi:hypothetical protein